MIFFVISINAIIKKIPESTDIQSQVTYNGNESCQRSIRYDILNDVLIWDQVIMRYALKATITIHIEYYRNNC